MELPKVISFQIPAKYKLHLHFLDGTQGIVDLAEYAGIGVMKLWDEGDNFFKATIAHGGRVIEWPNEIDMCVDSFYVTIRNISPEQWMNQETSHATT